MLCPHDDSCSMIFCVHFSVVVGDLGVTRSARDAYMKQKHRMVWERRHGKVGTGVKVQPTE